MVFDFLKQAEAKKNYKTDILIITLSRIGSFVLSGSCCLVINLRLLKVLPLSSLWLGFCSVSATVLTCGTGIHFYIEFGGSG